IFLPDRKTISRAKEAGCELGSHQLKMVKKAKKELEANSSSFFTLHNQLHLSYLYPFIRDLFLLTFDRNRKSFSTSLIISDQYITLFDFSFKDFLCDGVCQGLLDGSAEWTSSILRIISSFG